MTPTSSDPPDAQAELFLDEALAGDAPDSDCERCEGSGLDPDAYFVNEERTVWTHAPCSECLPKEAS